MMRNYSLKSALLSEAAMTPMDLAPDVGVIVRWFNPDRTMGEICFADITPEGFRKIKYDDKRYGILRIQKRLKGIGSYWVAWSSTSTDGWGPMLYDIGAELATLYGEGLTSDTEVSDAATNVWNYYLDHRDDVDFHQDDDRHNTLTPDPSDNRVQNPAKKWAFQNKVHWSESALSKRITKEPTTINQLKKIKKWHESID